MNTARLAVLFAQRPALDLNFQNEAVPGGLTISGGANGTRVNAAGTVVSASAPRFDYSPVSKAAKGLLVEETRTNLLTYSADFTQAAWVVADHTTTANTANGPDGALSADTITPTVGTGGYCVQNIAKAASAVQYAFSSYLKAAAGASLTLLMTDTVAGECSAVFNLSNGTAGSVLNGTWTGASASIEDAGGGWYRCTLVGTSPANNQMGAGFRGIGLNNTVYLWGAQLEASAFDTGHAPTVAAAVERTADAVTASFSGDSLTFAVEFDLNAVTGTRPIISLDDTTADNQIRLYASGTDLKLTVTAGGNTQADLTLGTVAANTTYKAAFSCCSNEFRALMTGGTEQSDTAGTMPAITTLRIGSDVAGNYQNGHNARTRGWNRRLSNLLSYV